ncbi:hypothetical protein C8A05DRAFT_38010 [Staphylotrichum tortipilum]|uniref:Uncharacterized protein n=1 Tax=Staphylotrichum tortipilum TaxID=2831512 RepID=A0AAN6MDX6_9PEZI|nr:hypothetical protein C8A05DRAFT_38010 [Staphylotrichum longicolle]
MEKLPLELMQSICAALCPHCQDPDAVPDRSATQRALANLSPSVVVVLRISSWGLRRVTKGRGALAFFMRSAADRPDLASHVSSLHLVKCASCPNGLRFDEEPIHTILGNLALTIGMNTGYSHPTLVRYTEYARLVRMAVLGFPNLKTLPLTRWINFGVFYDLDMGTVPSLETLSSNAVEENASFHIADAARLSAAFPNLEVLYASGCGGNDFANFHLPRRPPGRKPFDLPLGSLQKLAIHDLEFGDLLRLLPACPQIQELEYEPPGHPDGSPNPESLRVLRPVRKTLHILDLRIDFWKDNSSRISSFVPTPIQSFRRFPALKVLTVDHSAVNCPVSPASPAAGSATLVDWLPLLLEHVFFRHVAEQDIARFLDHLRILAFEAPKSRPTLRSVRISLGLLYEIPKKDLVDAVKPTLARLQAEFEQAGITFYEADPRTGGPAKDKPVAGSTVAANTAMGNAAPGTTAGTER